MLDRADCADFGCHNSIRLETKHFLNTLALTFIAFSGRFVFAMQKHYFFFASDPLVIKYLYYPTALKGRQSIAFTHGVWIVGRALWRGEKLCPGCISETIRRRKLILGRTLVGGCMCATSWFDLDLTFDLAVVTLSLKILSGLYLRNHKV